jgi:hypothetical protein
MDPTQATRVARLTHAQYEATVQDLLGITNTPATTFAPDALNGFRFDTSIDFRVDARLGPQYRAAAEELAELAVTDAAVFDRVVPCAATDAGCSAEFVQAFGQRAFRRPLNAEELARFGALFGRGAELVASGDAFRDGVRLVVEAMLQSPQFLYRAELGDAVGADGLIALDAWEVASRLSYFIYDSMPDDELFAQAGRGELGSVDQVAAAIRRMLEAPRATAKLVSFHEQAWQFDRFSRITPDTQTYPDAPENVVALVRDASLRFVAEVIEGGGGFSEFLSAPYAFADSGLAPLYGASVGGGMTRIDLDPAERKGFLMQVGFLASNAYAIKTDPIHRGLFVVRELLCRTVPDPPPGASMTPLPQTSEPIETTREEVSLLTGQDACVNCHALINPPGFAFEGFDAVGQFRASENGVPVDTSGSMEIDGAMVQFDGAVELVDALTASADARRCYAARWLEFAYGRRLGTTDAAAAADLGAVPRSVADIVAAVGTTPAFLNRVPNEVGP